MQNNKLRIKNSNHSMDFAATLKLIIKDFNKYNITYGVIGGFALGALGVARATIDLDFLVLKDDYPKVDKIMKTLGYECRYLSENVAQYVSGVKIFGEIDFLFAFREISSKMLQRAVEKEVFSGEIKIKVLKPEDIIGLKLQALVNDTSRTSKEYADIEALMDYYRETLDWAIIQEFFELFDLTKKFNELKKRFFAC